MPLSINVGLSRKASRDYQSTGVSINVTAELDQSLLARPDQLQQEIGRLYSQAEQALDRQADAMTDSPPSPPARSGKDRPRGRNGNGNGNGHAPMTHSQRRAINAIADRVGADAAEESQQLLNTDLDRLSLRQASQLIDHLKGLESSSAR